MGRQQQNLWSKVCEAQDDKYTLILQLYGIYFDGHVTSPILGSEDAFSCIASLTLITFFTIKQKRTVMQFNMAVN